MRTKVKPITNAVQIIKSRYYKTASRQADLEVARLNVQVARMIYNLRTQAGLSQKQMAELVGTTQSVISKLEDDDYEGHSLSMLNRISTALHKRISLTAIDI